VTPDLLALVSDLRRRGEPFALATVVRAERPTSAKAGAKALVQRDGTVVGWIGGACAEPVVVREALASIRDAEPRFIRLIGEGGRGPGRTEGSLEYPMTCSSGGTLEIYVEPWVPKPALVLIGHGPVLESLVELGRSSGFDVTVVGPGSQHEELAKLTPTPRTFVVVAGHGTADEDGLAWALGAGPGHVGTAAMYVSLVASRRRAAVIIETLRRRGVPAERLGTMKAPAGLDIGAVAPEEIAISILAEIVQVRRSPKTSEVASEIGSREATRAEPPGTATDPICEMLVEIATARYRSEFTGRAVYFCCSRCKETFDQDPERYVGASRA
jgi:xanthine dehydrogenase accessory factor